MGDLMRLAASDDKRNERQCETRELTVGKREIPESRAQKQQLGSAGIQIPLTPISLIVLLPLQQLFLSSPLDRSVY